MNADYNSQLSQLIWSSVLLVENSRNYRAPPWKRHTGNMAGNWNPKICMQNNPTHMKINSTCLHDTFCRHFSVLWLCACLPQTTSGNLRHSCFQTLTLHQLPLFSGILFLNLADADFPELQINQYSCFFFKKKIVFQLVMVVFDVCWEIQKCRNAFK